MLRRLFRGIDRGFYVDVGAHHPYRFSNTYLLYRRGWHGLNIDALPGTKLLFDRCRPRDQTIEVGVSTHRGSLTYWSFEEPAFNTFDEALGRERVRRGVSRLIDRQAVATLPLSEILAKNITTDRSIDLLTVDVEGLDLQVLQSNDWHRYRPGVVLCEVLASDLDETAGDEVYAFMLSVGYRLRSKLYTTAVFQTNEP